MVASIRTITSYFMGTKAREIAAMEPSKNLTEDDQDGLHGLLDEIFHLSGESLMIVSLNSDDETGENNKSFYSVVKKYCDLNNETHCLSIPSLDIKKTFEIDRHHNYLGTEYIANIIRDYMEGNNFLKSKNL